MHLGCHRHRWRPLSLKNKSGTERLIGFCIDWMPLGLVPLPPIPAALSQGAAIDATDGGPHFFAEHPSTHLWVLIGFLFVNPRRWSSFLETSSLNRVDSRARFFFAPPYDVSRSQIAL
jgi:hypothetical protein